MSRLPSPYLLKPQLSQIKLKKLKLLRCLILTSVLSLSALSACTSLTPDYTRPALPVATAFPGAASSLTDPSVSAASAASTAAPEALLLKNTPFATDPVLKPLLDLTLANNRDLRVAVLNIELAQAQLGVRQADLLPSVNLGIGGSRQTTASGSLSSNYSAGLSLTAVPAYEVDLFSRLRNLSDTARAQYLASVEARKTVQMGLLASVASTLLAWQSDTALLAITDKTLATREATAKLLQLRFDQGASALLDLRSAQSLLASARIARAQLQRQQSLDLNALTLLVGQSLPDAWLQAGVAKAQTWQPVLWPELPVGLPSEVLLARPDVAQAELQLQAANANIGAARAAFFPKITLTNTLGRASNDLAQLFQSGALGWSFGAQILQPLFDAGRNDSNLKIAQAGRAIAQAQYEKTVQTAFREVSDGLASRAALQAQWNAQTTQTQAEADRSRLAQLRYSQGASSYLDVLDAERALFTAQQALILVQAQHAQNTVALYRALGGGWGP
jgi:multidrug efflux system outer membrane protein